MFDYTLCLALGIPSPRIMRQIMTPADRAGWLKMYAHEPFGFLRDDWRAALIARATYTGPLKQPPKIADLMFESRTKAIARLLAEQSDAEIHATLHAAYRRRK